MTTATENWIVTRRWGLRAITVLMLIVLASFAYRIATDAPFLLDGTSPEPEEYEARYVAHPWITYLHMAPGVVYLLGACLQLSERFRTRHYTLHRRLGRILVAAALTSVALALVIGVRFPWGGRPQTVATLLFGGWFAVCLVLAVRAICSGDVAQHRRWMIRAFAMGLAVGTIRIWLGLLAGTGLVSLHDAFDPAFWLGFVAHAVAAELWLRATPAKSA